MIEFILTELVPPLCLAFSLGLFVWTRRLQAVADRDIQDAAQCLQATINLLNAFDKAVKIYSMDDPKVAQAFLKLNRDAARDTINRHTSEFVKRLEKRKERA